MVSSYLVRRRLALAPALSLLLVGIFPVGIAKAAEVPKPKPATMAELIRSSKPTDWRPLDPQNTLYLELSTGRVVIELAPAFAPAHITNIRALVREHYYDGLGIIRVQDNYVAQLGDFDADKPESARKTQSAKRTLPGEFDRPIDSSLPFAPLSDGDVYAPEVGFSNGFPVARDPKANKMWLVHCYGMVGVGRDVAADSGGGTELYVVIGQAPRHLDRNVTLVGRVWVGVDLLSALPRGEGALGFYQKREQCFPIKSVRLAADIPAEERTPLEVLRTDTALFQDLVEARRNRREEWFHHQAGRVEVCNVPVPIRMSATPAGR